MSNSRIDPHLEVSPVQRRVDDHGETGNRWISGIGEQGLLAFLEERCAQRLQHRGRFRVCINAVNDTDDRVGVLLQVTRYGSPKWTT